MEGIQIANIPIGSLGTVNRPVFHVPTAHGGITLTKAYVVSGAASTIVASLNNNGATLGTTVVTNIGTMAAAAGTLVANVPGTVTISTAYQAANSWIAFYTTTGITDASAMLILEYKYGK